jgi:hypothetical protein
VKIMRTIRMFGSVNAPKGEVKKNYRIDAPYKKIQSKLG